MEQPQRKTDSDHTSRATVVSRSLFVEDDNDNDGNPKEHLQREDQVLVDAMYVGHVEQLHEAVHGCHHFRISFTRLKPLPLTLWDPDLL